MKRSETKILILLIYIVIASCSTSKKIVSNSKMETCLELDPTNYHNARFNPKWISANGIKKIIEREYLDGKNGKVHTVSVFYYNSDGHKLTRYAGLSYPKDDSPNEKDIFSRWDYDYELQDSFLIQKSKIVRFHNQNGKMEKPDTLGMRISSLNLKSAKVLKNEEGNIIRRYKYDNQNRLTEVIDKEGKSMFKLKYLSDNKIEVEKYSPWKKEYKKSWATFNKKGQIVKNYDESNSATHEFFYNEKGELIVDKSYFKGKRPNYFTYEYIK